MKNILQNFALVILSTLAASAEAAISVDASATRTATGSWGTSLSWAHTTGSCANRVMVVTVGMNSAASVTGVSYGGMSFTQATFRTDAAGSRTDIWYLVNPPSGANNVTLTATTNVNIMINSVTYCGVDQSTPIGATAGVTSAASTIGATLSTTRANSWLVMVASGYSTMSSSGMTANNATLNIGAGGGQIYSVHAYKTTTSTGSYTVNATGGSGNNNVLSAVELLEAGAGTNTVTPTISPTPSITPSFTESPVTCPAISRDPGGSAYAGQSVIPSLSYNISGSGTCSNCVLLVSVSSDNNSATPATLTAVTYGGNSLVMLTRTTSADRRLDLWALTNPPSGTATINITFSAAQATPFNNIITAVAYHNASLTGVYATSNVGGSPITSTLVTTVNNAVIAGAAFNNNPGAAASATSGFNSITIGATTTSPGGNIRQWDINVATAGTSQGVSFTGNTPILVAEAELQPACSPTTPTSTPTISPTPSITPFVCAGISNDPGGSAYAGQNTIPSLSYNISGSGTCSNCVLLVSVSSDNNSALPATLTAVTYGGNNLVMLTRTTSADRRLDLWALTDPPSGTATINISFSAAQTAPFNNIITAVAYHDAALTGVYATSAAAGSPITSTLVTTVNNAVIAGGAFNNNNTNTSSSTSGFNSVTIGVTTTSPGGNLRQWDIDVATAGTSQGVSFSGNSPILVAEAELQPFCGTPTITPTFSVSPTISPTNTPWLAGCTGIFTDISAMNRGSSGTITVPFTVSSFCNDPILVVGTTTCQQAGVVSAVSYAGQSLTLINTATSSNEAESKLWYLLDPPNGVPGNITVTATGGAGVNVIATSYCGVGSIGATGTSVGQNTSYSVNVTTTQPGSMIAGIVDVKSSAVPVVTPQGVVYTENETAISPGGNNTTSALFWDLTTTAAGTYTAPFTSGTNNLWYAIAAVEMVAVCVPTPTWTPTITRTRTPSFTFSPTNSPSPSPTATPRMQLVKSSSVPSGVPGDTVSFCIAWSNDANSNQDINIWDTLSSFITYVGCDNSCSRTGQLVSWTLAGQVPGASGSVCVWGTINGYPWIPELMEWPAAQAALRPRGWRDDLFLALAP